jgi:hypothetical protein
MTTVVQAVQGIDASSLSSPVATGAVGSRITYYTRVARREVRPKERYLGTLAREISAISSTGLSPSVATLSRVFGYRLIW